MVQRVNSMLCIYQFFLKNVLQYILQLILEQLEWKRKAAVKDGKDVE